jgi:hypothetical protein
MKKIYLSALLGLLVVFFTSCTKEYVSSDTANQTIILSVSYEGWSTSDGITYSAFLNVPQLSSYLNETGEVLVYLSYGDGVYEQIPEVSGHISYSFTHYPGNITLYVQDLNERGIEPPTTTQVKIVLVPSHY